MVKDRLDLIPSKDIALPVALATLQLIRLRIKVILLPLRARLADDAFIPVTVAHAQLERVSARRTIPASRVIPNPVLIAPFHTSLGLTREAVAILDAGIAAVPALEEVDAAGK